MTKLTLAQVIANIRHVAERANTAQQTQHDLSGCDAVPVAVLADSHPRGPDYRHPKTHETWNGVGNVPAWIKRAEAQGLNRELFLIDNFR